MTDDQLVALIAGVLYATAGTEVAKYTHTSDQLRQLQQNVVGLGWRFLELARLQRPPTAPS